MAQILDGKILNEKIAEELTRQIRGLTPKPKLVIIQVGDVPESNAYIGRKVKFGEKIGAIVDHQKFPEDVTQEKLQTTVYKLNTDSSVHGVIIQMPIPEHLDKDALIDTINPVKDVDGLTSVNLKHLWEGPNSHPKFSSGSRNQILDQAENDKTEGRIAPGFTPATTKGVITLLNEYKIPIAGKHVVVVGRSFLVGKPTFLAFLNRDATVTIAHSRTKNLPKITKQTDILVVATGKPNLIGKEHVHKDQVVVDVGINVLENEDSPRQEQSSPSLKEDGPRRLVGDVNFAEVEPIVKAITPVPGGVGPMTVASLFQNLLEAYINQIQK
ncbi:bifunctional 5,10-methylenetetrahydrofolate dehydrogenase/5,10-methenyltetrahydrofolate cyclohydrolase [Candidatus Curtissbacteria bacterium]|nr:bifunctional 5,10-methylenetetrahydrofolate dehydrogenase/5,10-methenyltetrahydrofolate cyclohydrolase [Candidatus Curtissbacteria bacterium]